MRNFEVLLWSLTFLAFMWLATQAFALLCTFIQNIPSNTVLLINYIYAGIINASWATRWFVEDSTPDVLEWVREMFWVVPRWIGKALRVGLWEGVRYAGWGCVFVVLAAVLVFGASFVCVPVSVSYARMRMRGEETNMS